MLCHLSSGKAPTPFALLKGSLQNGRLIVDEQLGIELVELDIYPGHPVATCYHYSWQPVVPVRLKPLT